MGIIIQLLILAFGFLLLTKGADWFVGGAASIAERLRIPQLIIGLTVVAIGTSAPEAAVSISAALKGTADITIGNIIGSNLMNILVILGLAAVIVPLNVARSAIRVEIPFMIGIFILFIALGLDGTVGLFDGAVLWVLFIAYLVYLYVSARKLAGASGSSETGSTGDVDISSASPDAASCNEESPGSAGAVDVGISDVANASSNGDVVPVNDDLQADEGSLVNGESRSDEGSSVACGGALPDDGSAAKQISLLKATAAVVGGSIIIIWGSDIAVEAATVLARQLGFSERFIGLTIVALGTSLPELVTSVTAATRGKADIAVGNIIGSCLFNILFVLGTSALIIPITFSAELLPDALAAAMSAMILWLFSFRAKKLSRPAGIIMLVCYAMYFFFVLI